MIGLPFVLGVSLCVGLGLIFGSFVNAWVWRVSVGRSIARGRSLCPHCKTALGGRELVPVLSYIVLGGRCRHCHRAISPRYPIVELIGGLSFGLLYWAFQPASWLGLAQLVVLLSISVFLLAAASYDQAHSLLPDDFTLPALGLAVVYLLISTGLATSLIVPRLIGTALGTGLFYGLWRLSDGRAMGDGDARLVAIMGLMLSPWQLMVALTASFNSGAVVAIILLMFGRKKRGDQIAFGPFLIFGLYFGLLVADKIKIF